MVAPYGRNGCAGVVDVVLEQRAPLRVEVLGDPPLVAAREAVHDPGHHPQRPLEQTPVARDVGRREQCLDRVHVGVDAAVAVERA